MVKACKFSLLTFAKPNLFVPLPCHSSFSFIFAKSTLPLLKGLSGKNHGVPRYMYCRYLGTYRTSIRTGVTLTVYKKIVEKRPPQKSADFRSMTYRILGGYWDLIYRANHFVTFKRCINFELHPSEKDYCINRSLERLGIGVSDAYFKGESIKEKISLCRYLGFLFEEEYLLLCSTYI